LLTSLKRLALALVVLVTLLGGSFSHAQGTVTEINFYYPAVVGGPITRVMDEFAKEFNQANPDIKVNTVYAGNDYPTIYKTIQEKLSKGEKGPDVAIFLTTDLYYLMDSNTIVPLDDFISKSPDGANYLSDFFPAFLLNSQANGKTWGIPFQRSTPVLFYNMDHFAQLNLDPDAALKTWQDMLITAQLLTKPNGERWGLEIPSGFYWFFQSFAISNGQNLVDDAANKVYFNAVSTIDAMQFFADLSFKYKVMPTGVIQFGDPVTDFLNGKAAMIYHTTGSLTNILANANFPVGVTFLPQGKKGYGVPTGGGNLYILKSSPAENQQAAWRWIQFLSSPEKQADWTVATGYIAARKSAWKLDAIHDLVEAFPQYAVARDQLQYASKELATHQGPSVQALFATALKEVLTGVKTPKQALDDAQKAADALLTTYKD
jgi:sn-glycerol 3-phosphate transport system substrate-binding protein